MWDSVARIWLGKDVVRTTKWDHAQQQSFLLGTPSLKAAGCLMDPVVVIARYRVVMCILQCCMAMGRLQMANIERLINDRLAPGDRVTCAPIYASLHEHRIGCVLWKDDEETSRLFAVWPGWALLLAVTPDEPLYVAIMAIVGMA